MRWFLPLALFASTAAAQFPLQVPTRPTSFPLTRLTNEGVIVGWGTNSYGQTVPPVQVERPLSAAAGGPHSLAILWNGTVFAWGAGSGKDGSYSGQFYGDAVQIDANAQLSLVLTESGKPVAWGSFPGKSVPSTLVNAVQVAAGQNHGLAVKADGTVVAWGDNTWGQRSVPSGLSNVVQVAANSTSYALKSDGTVVAWGSGNSLPPGVANVVQIAAMQSGCALLHSDGTVTVASITQTDKPASLTNVVQIDGGLNCLVARLSDGTVKVWNDVAGSLPDPPLGLSNVTHVSLSESHVLAFVVPSGTPSLYVLAGQPLQHVAHQGVLSNLVAVVSNSSSATNLVLSNLGSANLQVLSATLAGMNSQDFSLGDFPSSEIPPGDSSVLPVSFLPTGVGVRQAVLTIESNDPLTPSYQVDLSAIGLNTTIDSDSDGLNDAAEYLMRGMGFDWESAQPELVQVLYENAYAAGLYTSNNVTTNAAFFGLYTAAEYSAQFESGRSSGQADVTNSPASFGLFTQPQYDGNRIAGRQDVISDPASFNLYDETSIMDLSFGAKMVKKEGGNAVFELRLQTTTNISTQPFSDYGDPVTNTIPMPGRAGFLRVRAVDAP
jgi:hypothetical protein